MLSLQSVLLLVSLALLQISLVACVSEDLGVYGNQEEFKDPDDEQMQNMLDEMYRNYPLDQYEDSYEEPSLVKTHFANYVAKRFSNFIDSKRFSEFLGGKKKRFSEFLGGKKRFSEFLGGKKRFSEFLGGKKRFSEFLGGKKRFSEFLGGKRSSRSLPVKRDFDFLGGR